MKEIKEEIKRGSLNMSQTVDSNFGLPPNTETREDFVNSILAYSAEDCGPRTGGVTLCC